MIIRFLGLLPLLLGLLLPFSALAANPTSFCKCTCFKTNSTIIALDPPVTPAHSKTSPRALLPLPPRSPFLGFAREEPEDSLVPEDGEGDQGAPPGEMEEPGGDNRKELRAGNCKDCTRAECIKYGLPGCEGAGVEDVFTTCFQRDSTKDQAVVFIFIFATVGLLIWAMVGPWVGGWMRGARERRTYIPLANTS